MSVTSNSISVTTDDIHSVEDVIDLNQAYEDGRITSMSGNNNNKSNYRISLHSIDDDELKRFHRDLVTPAPSVCFDDDHIQQSMFRSRQYYHQTPTASTSYPRPASRTESVMLFKKINNGDEDVSFDLVSSEFKDFLDTDFMDDILSRPVSRTTISKNASKIQDINKFRNTFNYGKTFPVKKASGDLSSPKSMVRPLQQQQQQKKKTTAILHSESILENNSTSPSLNPRLTAVTKGDNKFRSTHENQRVVPEQKRFNIDLSSRDEYMYKRIPRRFASNITSVNTSTSMPTSLLSRQQREKSTQKQESLLQPPIVVMNEPGENNNIRHRSNNSAFHRSYTKNEEISDPDIYKQPVTFESSTPPVSRRYRQFSASNNIRRFERNRSDTTSSSSSDEPSEEYYQRSSNPISINSTATRGGLVRDINPYSMSAQDLQQPKSAPSSDQYHLQHRYSVPNTRFVNNETNKSPSFLRPNKPINYMSSNNDQSGLSVTDSAKQVLACIRERRKSAMEQSPKIEGRTTRFHSSAQQHDLASDFRSRLQIHRDSMQHRRSGSINNEKYPSSYSNNKRYDVHLQQQQYETNDRYLLTSRLPQRTNLYR